MTEKQSIKINPETALGYVDGALVKYQGTRDDHKVLEASMALLKNIVIEWQSLKTTKESPKPDPVKAKATSKKTTRPRK